MKKKSTFINTEKTFSLKNTTHFVDILGGVIGKGVAILLTSIMAASVKVS